MKNSWENILLGNTVFLHGRLMTMHLNQKAIKSINLHTSANHQIIAVLQILAMQ